MKPSGIYVNLILSCSVLFLSLEVCACRFMLTLQNEKCALCIVRRIQLSRNVSPSHADKMSDDVKLFSESTAQCVLLQASD